MELEGQVHLAVRLEVEGQVHLGVEVEVDGQISPSWSRGGGGGTRAFRLRG
jgi:hypothetical protein